MKKVGLLSVITSISLINLVSAQTNAEVFWKNTAEWFSNIFSGVQLDPTNFTLILFGILVWMVIYGVIRNIGFFKDYGWVWSGVFALVVTFLALKGFPPEYIETILINYQAMGGTIIVLIPTLIIAWFTIATEDTSLIISRLIWLVYTIFYFSLIVFKIGISSAAVFSLENAPYVLAFILGIVVLIFLGVLRAIYWKEKLESKKEKAERRAEGMGAGIDAANKILQEAAGTG